MTNWRLGPYRALEHVFAVHGVDSQPVRTRLERALEPLASPDDAMPEVAYRVTPMGGPSSSLYRLTYGTRLIARGQSAYHAAGHVLWHVNQRAVTLDRGRHMILHAAGVERDGVLVVLLGDSGVGKTTTTAGLLRAGFRYLTDEAVALDRDTRKVTAFPKALALNDDVVGLFRESDPPERPGPGDPVRHLTWRDLGSPGVTGGVAPRLIVALSKPDADVGLAAGEWGPVSTADATLNLAQATFRFRSRPRQNLEAAAALAEEVPAFRLVTGDVDRSVATIGSWVDSISSGSVPSESDRSIDHGGTGDSFPEVHVDAESRYRAVGGLTVVQSGDALVVRHSASGQSAVLEGTALAVWQGLDGRSTLAHAAERLAADYSAPIGAVRADVESLVATLLGLGLVRASDGPH